ncbi:phage portal protein [uncultured Anaerococcus sp.]|uniref:phage portal protein n=1 Tax=uncultured Anaerococcus sp. TaxID=293428 RepID=UPI0025EC7A51|nr:phage portal protein [uncultured Anaerococcus sp.]
MAGKSQSYISEYMELPKRICLPTDTEISPDLIETLMEIKNKDNERYLTLQKYYNGWAKILERTRDEEKSNNKIVLAYPAYIVDILQGMAVGRPVTYTVPDEFRDKFLSVQDILDLNREQDENTALAKMGGINGVGYEINYIDEEGNFRFNEILPQNMIYVWDDKINPEPWMAIYVRDAITLENLTADEKAQAATVYTADRIYEYVPGQGGFKLEEEYENALGMFPVIEFANNDEYIGDFERELTQIDEMNLLYSDNANSFEETINALLILWGMVNTDSDDFKKLREDGVLLATSEGTGGKQDAKFLTKDINDTAIENFKKNLDEAIHKFSKAPNVTDEKFSGTASGESQKYKVFTTDQIIELKKRKFHTALTKRLELICEYLRIKQGIDLDYREIAINFQDNKPYDELQNAQTVKQLLDAGASRQYAFSKLKGIDDVAEELERQRQEMDAYSDLFADTTKDMMYGQDDLGDNAKEVPEASRG